MSTEICTVRTKAYELRAIRHSGRADEGPDRLRMAIVIGVVGSIESMQISIDRVQWANFSKQVDAGFKEYELDSER